MQSFQIHEIRTPSNTTHLTKRQFDCLVYLVKGMTMKMIAKKLSLSPKTVEHYIYALRDKMNCNSRMEMIEQALTMQSIREKIYI